MITAEPSIAEAIASRNEQLMARYAEGDAAAIAELYTSDALLFPPGCEEARGYRTITAFWRATMLSGRGGIRLETREVEALGDTAIETGRYTILGKEREIVDVGKYLAVWKRKGRAWFFHRDIWNSDGGE